MPKSASKRNRLSIGLVSILLSCCFYAPAYPVVLNFDDLAGLVNVTNSSYAQLTWEQGNLGLSNLNGAWFSSDGSGIFNYPHSGIRNLINAQAATLMGIGFPSLVEVHGAYFSGQGNFAATTSIRAHGFLSGLEVGATAWLTPITTTPQWLDMTGLSNVDRIVIESAPVFENVGAYGMDDLTFTYVPEPASLTMLGLAGAGLLSRRRRG